MSSNWTRTFTGKKFFILAPRQKDVDHIDIAHQLGMMCRFNGCLTRFYSVAQHLCHCHDEAESILLQGNRPFDYVRPYAFAALMHDTSEAYMVDLARPVKHSRTMQKFRDVEHRLESCIAKKYGCLYPWPPIVKEVDDILLTTEAYQLHKGFDKEWHHWTLQDKMIQGVLPVWGPEKATEQWLKRFYLYVPQAQKDGE